MFGWFGCAVGRWVMLSFLVFCLGDVASTKSALELEEKEECRNSWSLWVKAPVVLAMP